MCEIVGWVGEPAECVDRHTRGFARLLRHHRPDDEGHDARPGWGLALRPLSILDLSPLAHQPMRSPDGRCGSPPSLWIAL